MSKLRKSLDTTIKRTQRIQGCLYNPSIHQKFISVDFARDRKTSPPLQAMGGAGRHPSAILHCETERLARTGNFGSGHAFFWRFEMKTLAAAVLAAPLALLAPIAQAADTIYDDPAPVAGDSGGVRLGTLRCDIDGGVGYVFGSAKEVACTFNGRDGSSDSYSGVMRKLGVDLGYTRHSRLVWAVFAPTAGPHHGSLAGRYRGATAEVTAGTSMTLNAN
jgi:hypothetical protein